MLEEIELYYLWYPSVSSLRVDLLLMFWEITRMLCLISIIFLYLSLLSKLHIMVVCLSA